MTRKFLRSVGFALIGALLFAQMAIASYACPALASPMRMQMPSGESTTRDLTKPALSAEGSQAMNCEDMAGAVDNSNGTLCAEHCRFGQSSSDTPTITVPMALLSLLYSVPPAPEPVAAPHTAAGRPGVLGAAAPPHAILHCCWRI